MSLTNLTFSPTASLDELLKIAESKFPVKFEPLKIGDYELEILQIADLEQYIDHLASSTKEGQSLELPFWAKIWPSSILLSYFIQKYSPSQMDDVLEIGSGLGICGLFAAKHGFNITLTDNCEDALLFCQINILKNELKHKAQIQRIDFAHDNLPQRYPLILGSDVLYREDTYRPLVEFLLSHLKITGQSEIILSMEHWLSAKSFFQLAQKHFFIKKHSLGYKEKNQPEEKAEKHLSHIYRLLPQ